MTPVKLLGFAGAAAVHGATLLIAFSGIALLVLTRNKSEFTLYVYTLNHLLWRDSQRAEYLADHLSARVAGTDAALSALHMLCLANTCVGLRWDARLVQDVAEGSITDLYEELRGRVARLPERERDRVRRVERLASFRLDATHPPTAYRIALLDARPALDPTVHLSPGESVALARELAAVEHRAQEQIVEAYKRRQSSKNDADRRS